MSQTKQITVYDFTELSDTAKQKVAQWLNQDGYAWQEESMDSVKAFAAQFGVKLTKLELSTWGNSFIDTNADNSNFRGFTLADAKKLPEYPTGYCIDATLHETFIKSFEKTGSAKDAFTSAIDAAVADIISGWEYQESEEAIAEMCEVNGYQFDEFGRIV